MGAIVVGVDDSAGAKEALRFALEEARVRRVGLRAVHALGSLGSYYLTAVDVGVVHRAAEEMIENAIREVPSEDGSAEIERGVVEGAPATVLVEESRGADLLVVGSRGHGGFVGLLLGSVSQQCAHHAECPVVIVRAPSGKSD